MRKIYGLTPALMGDPSCVKMELEHSLASGGAVVESEVECVWWRYERVCKLLLSPIYPIEQASFLPACEVFETSHGTAGDDEGVPGGDRELVTDYGEQIAGCHNASGLNHTKSWKI
jgi:hypothetical protein